MTPCRIPIIVNTASNDYTDTICLIALGICRKLGYACPADMLTRAYHIYNPNMPHDVLEIIKERKTCKHFIAHFRIRYKEDIHFILRRPDLQDNNNYSEMPNIERRLITFNDTEDPEQAALAEFLNSMKPKERTAEITRILEQYFVKTDDTFYFEQYTLRLYQYLSELAIFDSEGNLDTDNENVDILIDLINTIWELGKTEALPQ